MITTSPSASSSDIRDACLTRWERLLFVSACHHGWGSAMTILQGMFSWGKGHNFAVRPGSSVCFLAHSHRGFSPVPTEFRDTWNRFNGFGFLHSAHSKPLKRLTHYRSSSQTGNNLHQLQRVGGLRYVNLITRSSSLTFQRRGTNQIYSRGNFLTSSGTVVTGKAMPVSLPARVLTISEPCADLVCSGRVFSSNRTTCSPGGKSPIRK